MKQGLAHIVVTLALFSGSFTSHAQWINEIHYDNTSTDVGECIEVAGTAGINLACLQLVLYNGGTGAAYSTVTLSGTMPDAGCGYGVVSHCYASNGIQNGGPDGMALYNSCTNTLIQFLSYEGSFTATDGPAIGITSTDIGVSQGGAGAVGLSLQLTGSGIAYNNFVWQNEATSSFGTLNTGQTISPCGSPNTLTISSISSTTFAVDCSTSASGQVNFVSSGTFNPGNVYSVQLSDSLGNFTFPTVIGSLNSTANSGSISIVIPEGTPSGSGYLIQLSSTDPQTTSPPFASPIQITLTEPCTPPYITSVIINSCNETCTEGYNEIVFGNSGDYSFDVAPNSFNISYGTSLPGTNYTDVLVNNNTTINAINAAAGCPGTFIDATGTTIPPGASWMMAYDEICEEALDWSGLCNSGPIYVIFQDDPNWNLSGTFKNGPDGGPRFFNSTITTTNGLTFSIDYEYNSMNLQSGAAGDGDFVSWDSDGGNPVYYGDNNCILEPEVLPVQLISFQGEQVLNQNVLLWTTLSEINSDYFVVDRSTDGQVWEEVGMHPAAQFTTIEQHYSLYDIDFKPTINYYRLRQVDMDGTEFRFPTYVSIDNRSNSESELVGIFNLLGQEISHETQGIQIHVFSDGTSYRMFK